MNENRLTRLAAALDLVAPDRFDLLEWRTHMTSNVSKSNSNLLDPCCNTAGCAIGWACALPEFVTEGLTWTGYEPFYHNAWGWEAVENFFEIANMQAEYLFSNAAYTGNVPPMVVASRIRKFIIDPTKAVPTKTLGESNYRIKPFLFR